MPSPRLRAISLTIEEPEPGLFEWILNEGAPSSSREIDASEDDYPTWNEALDAGIVALRALAQDADHGPREPLDDVR